MLKKFGETIYKKDQKIHSSDDEGKASTPVSPVMGFIPSPEKRVAKWLENHGVEKGSPRYKRELFFKGKKSNIGDSSPLINICLSNSGLFQRRSQAVMEHKYGDQEKLTSFTMKPIQVPYFEE